MYLFKNEEILTTIANQHEKYKKIYRSSIEKVTEKT